MAVPECIKIAVWHIGVIHQCVGTVCQIIILVIRIGSKIQHMPDIVQFHSLSSKKRCTDCTASLQNRFEIGLIILCTCVGIIFIDKLQKTDTHIPFDLRRKPPHAEDNLVFQGQKRILLFADCRQRVIHGVGQCLVAKILDCKLPLKHVPNRRQ